jgi:replication initiation and membrane attachment protein DnaB
MVLWLVSYNRTQVIVSLPHSLSGEGSLRSGQDDEEVFSGKPEDVKSDMDLTNAIRALRKKYRAYYLETFRLMLKSRLKWKPDSKAMDQLLEKAKEYKASPDQTLQARKTSLEDRMKVCGQRGCM